MTQENASGTNHRRPLSAITGAYLENYDYLKRLLARFFSDRRDIEDVAQEAYLRAYVAEQQKDIAQPRAYLFRIARNVALSKLTKKSEKITDYLEESGASVVIECGASADSEVEAQQSLGIYCEAVAALPEKCRQALLLRKVHGLSHNEIAERMSLSVSSVEKYLHKGILDCKAFVDNHEGRVPNRKNSAAGESGRIKGKQ